MKFGVLAGNFGTFGEDPGVDGSIKVAEEAERLGFDSVWVHDHIIMPSNVESKYPYNETGASPFRVDQFIFDPITVMAAIAARTSRVQIGTSVLVVPYRNPLVLAKELATIDRISHGRVVLGIGAGWMAEEFEAIGIGEHYPHRGAMTDEWMAVCVNLWTQTGPSSFKGRWIQYENVGANPLPVQKPHIPIWVGGKTPAAQRRVARYGSGYHTITSTPAEVAAEVAAVHGLMERAGRDPDSLVVSMLWAGLGLSGTQQVVDVLGEYARAGMHHLVGIPWLLDGGRFMEMAPHDRLKAQLENMELFADGVRPAVG
ncbi:MAG: TIGR03619 family F420-dependent LLM class oxidoreductase [Dehalococcoidia bacterium]